MTLERNVKEGHHRILIEVMIEVPIHTTTETTRNYVSDMLDLFTHNEGTVKFITVHKQEA